MRFRDFFTHTYLDTIRYTNELEAKLERCQQLLVSAQEVEQTINRCRQEMHLLFAEIEMAMQTMGFVVGQFRRLPLPNAAPPPPPEIFTNERRQREHGHVEKP